MLSWLLRVLLGGQPEPKPPCVYSITLGDDAYHFEAPTPDELFEVIDTIKPGLIPPPAALRLQYPKVYQPSSN